MEKKRIDLSIIIPCYEVEKYLRKCVESVLHQPFAENDIAYEIILVDDCSPDGVLAICEEYASAYPSLITVYHHEKNKGLSAARNTGVKHAQGTYIMFLDSDDSAIGTVIYHMYTQLVSANADMVIGGYVSVDEDGTYRKEHRFSENLTMSGEEIIQNWFKYRTLFTCPVNKMYRKELFIPFQVGKKYEDLYNTHLLIQKCDTVVCTTENVFLRLWRSTGIMGQTASKDFTYGHDEIEGLIVRAMFFVQKKNYRSAKTDIRTAIAKMHAEMKRTPTEYLRNTDTAERCKAELKQLVWTCAKDTGDIKFIVGCIMRTLGIR